MKYLIAVLPAVILLLPKVSEAAGLVPCGGYSEHACTTSDVITFASTLIEWLITMLGVIAVIALVYTGFRMVISAGDEGAWKQAKEQFTNIVIGIVIILAAFLVVDTILKALTSKSLEQWSGGLVVSPKDDTSSGDTSNTTQSSNNTTTGTCADCVKVTSVSCKNSDSCSVSSFYASRLDDLVTNSGETLQVTEAWPPSQNHQASCHQNGTCTDIVFSDRQFTTDRIKAFQQAAADTGMRAVFEPGPGGSCSGISDCLENSTTHATGDHFSLYLN